MDKVSNHEGWGRSERDLERDLSFQILNKLANKAASNRQAPQSVNEDWRDGPCDAPPTVHQI